MILCRVAAVEGLREYHTVQSLILTRSMPRGWVIIVELKKGIKCKNQRTNGPVKAHLISWPSKAQNIQNL